MAKAATTALENPQIAEVIALLRQQNELLAQVLGVKPTPLAAIAPMPQAVAAVAEIATPPVGAPQAAAPVEVQDPGKLETYYFRRKSTGAVIACIQGVDDAKLKLIKAGVESGAIEQISREEYEAARDEPAVPAKAPEPEGTAPGITRDMVRDMLIKLRDAGGKGANKAQVAVILQQHGASNFHDLADNKLADCYADAKMALEGI